MAHDQMAAGTFLVALPTLASCTIVITKVTYVRETLIQILNFIELDYIWLRTSTGMPKCCIANAARSERYVYIKMILQIDSYLVCSVSIVKLVATSNL